MDENHLLAKIGQYALIRNDEKKVLILERVKSKTWSLPGGRLNVDEEWDKAFCREIKEETNLNVTKMRPFANNIITDPYQIKYCVYFETFVSDIDNLKISSEHSNNKWVALEDLLEIKFEDELVKKVVMDFVKN